MQPDTELDSSKTCISNQREVKLNYTSVLGNVPRPPCNKVIILPTTGLVIFNEAANRIDGRQHYYGEPGPGTILPAPHGRRSRDRQTDLLRIVVVGVSQPDPRQCPTTASRAACCWIHLLQPLQVPLMASQQREDCFVSTTGCGRIWNRLDSFPLSFFLSCSGTTFASTE